ncbi:hypothetical protein [Plesiomonas shigelloides]|uniref:hypothetical protein n=1 Tax=Plesiomonas shigelloides TaxID=703 RepID=UPI00126221F8|nr:hypothetical protein [Plesiomonas shigelloides]KAB7668303.1 hypothetical protein GBN25_03420 [Plesiomonas shigelloides]
MRRFTKYRTGIVFVSRQNSRFTGLVSNLTRASRRQRPKITRPPTPKITTMPRAKKQKFSQGSPDKRQKDKKMRDER